MGTGCLVGNGDQRLGGNGDLTREEWGPDARGGMGTRGTRKLGPVARELGWNARGNGNQWRGG